MMHNQVLKVKKPIRQEQREIFTSLVPKQDKQSSWQSSGKQLREAKK